MSDFISKCIFCFHHIKICSFTPFQDTRTNWSTSLVNCKYVSWQRAPVLIQETGRKNRQKINQMPNALMHDVFVATQFSIYYSVCICSGQSQLSKESWQFTTQELTFTNPQWPILLSLYGTPIVNVYCNTVWIFHSHTQALSCLV